MELHLILFKRKANGLAAYEKVLMHINIVLLIDFLD